MAGLSVVAGAALGSHYTSFGRTVPSGCSTVTTIEVVRQLMKKILIIVFNDDDTTFEMMPPKEEV
jgi:hypothetical protein